MAEFDAARAALARNEAMDRVDRHAEDDWKHAVDDIVADLAGRVPRFTTDRVLWECDKRGVPEPHELRALGPRMTFAKGKGLIEKTDQFVRSVRPSRHGAHIMVWKSRVK